MLYILKIILFAIIFIIIFCIIFKVNIKIGKYDFRFNTFREKGLPRLDDRYGCWYVTGKQGSYKNMFATYLTTRQNFKLLNKIYTNIKSLNIPGADIHYFSKANELYYNTDEYCIFIIDELSRKYDRNSRTDTQFYAWLNQSRKRKRIVIMITQEWRELPMWIRRPAKYMFTTKPCILSLFGIYKTIMGDAENLVFNKDEGEYECPTLRYIFWKPYLKIGKMYDTFESVDEL